VEDGAYKLFGVMTDNSGNIGTTDPQTVVVNNYSVGSSNDNPKLITTCQEFQDINNKQGWHYRLENDIDCSGIASFAPIGDFGGELNGQNHIVSNLHMNTADNSGVFSNISSGGVISDIVFKNVDINCGSTYCGGLTNTNFGTIQRAGLTGNLICNGKCGGFASQNSGLITDSWVDMTISGNPGYAGLIAGQNYTGRVENCYAKGSLVASQGGGLIGLNERWIGGGWAQGSYSAVRISDSGSNGGVLGWQYQGGTQANNYWDKEVSGKTNMCGSYAYNGPENCNDQAGLTTAQMKNSENYGGWDFVEKWAIDPTKNDGYPYLRWQTFFTSKDVTNPVITLKGSARVEITVGDTYVDAGATASDNVDGDISSKIEIKNLVDASKAGTYLVTYDVSDEAGNEANQESRTVVVKEKEVVVSTGGGGAVLMPTACVSVEYSDWGVCIDGKQYRNFKSMNPASCQITPAQVEAGKQACGQVSGEVKNETVKPEEKKGDDKVLPAVLGVKNYPDGTLLRDPKTKKIYVVGVNGKYHIKNLKELRANYKGKRVINVASEVLAQYKDVATPALVFEKKSVK
jgi:hypothetical protein